MTAGTSSATAAIDSERQPLLDPIKSKTSAYQDGSPEEEEEVTQIIIVENADEEPEAAQPTSKFTIWRNVILVILALAGLGLFIKAFIDAGDVKV